MANKAVLIQEYFIKGWDFNKAGEASIKLQETLKEIGVSADVLRRVAIAVYEAEMNVVMYAKQGTLRCEISEDIINITLTDEGPGIEDIELAMKSGCSTATPEIREMGFGAGMGLPNIKRNSDYFNISSVVGSGAKLEMQFYL